jgi:hypothetical protein
VTVGSLRPAPSASSALVRCWQTQVPSEGVTLAGTTTEDVVVAVTGTELISYQSADNGKTWTPAT